MRDCVSFFLFEFENIFAFVFWNPRLPRFVNFSFPKKSVDKSGFVDKSGVDKSEDALYVIFHDLNDSSPASSTDYVKVRKNNYFL